MPKAPRGKRVADPSGVSFRVVNKAPNGEAELYFDRSRQVWVAPWRPTVVTNLFASGSLELEDVARFVGHNDVARRAATSSTKAIVLGR